MSPTHASIWVRRQGPVTVRMGDEAASLTTREQQALAPANASAVDGAPQASGVPCPKAQTIQQNNNRENTAFDTLPNPATSSRRQHRISIACAHCRRRKIRCLLAENDAHERCQNCIRLKKECVFYPVDQQQALDNRSQSGPKSGAASVPSSAVSPSPPELASGRPFERNRQYGSFASLPSLPSNAPPGFGMPIGSGSNLAGQGDFLPGYAAHGMPEADGVGMSGEEYGFHQTPTDSHRPWEQMGDLRSPNAPMANARDSMQSQYWRSSSTGSGPSADFAPFPTNGTAMSQIPSDFSYPMPNSQSWHPSQTARSISYGQMQDVGPPGYNPSPVGYAPQPAQEVQPAAATTFPPVDTSRHATASEQHSAAHGMPYAQPSPFMFQSQGGISVSPLPGQIPFTHNQWYGGNPQYGNTDQDLRSPTDQRSDKRSYTRINRGGYSEGDAIWIPFFDTFFRKDVGSGHMDWRDRSGTASAFAREISAQHGKHTALKPRRGILGEDGMDWEAGVKTSLSLSIYIHEAFPFDIAIVRQDDSSGSSITGFGNDRTMYHCGILYSHRGLVPLSPGLYRTIAQYRPSTAFSKLSEEMEHAREDGEEELASKRHRFLYGATCLRSHYANP
ncbi:hypothetical protein Q7P37_002224 [Cladosporium fusiforme]